MSRVIAADRAAMAAKSDAMFPAAQRGGLAAIGLMRDELQRQGVSADLHGAVTADQGWEIIQREVNAGRPVIMRTDAGVLSLAGHFFVAVGHRGSGSTCEVITHDPFGQWNGWPCRLLPAGCKGNYDRNTPDALSGKGRRAYCKFDTVFGRSNYPVSVQGRRVDAHLTQS